MAKSDPGKERAKTKEERRARSLANLRPSKKGEVRNPLGKNGRERSDYVVGVLSELDAKGVPNIRNVLIAQVKRAIRSSDVAAKSLIEQFAGKARQQIDLTSTDRSMSPNRKPTTAETRHELDRVLAVLERTAPVPASTEATPAPAGGEQGGAAAAAEPKAQP